MNTLMLADGTVMKMYRDEILTTVENNGTYVKGIKLTIADSNLDTLRNVLKDSEKLSSFSIISEAKSFSRTFSGYQFVKSISLNTELTTEYGSDVFEVTLGMTSDVKELIDIWASRLDEGDKIIEKLSTTINEKNKTIESLNTAIEEINKTNENLDTKIGLINKDIVGVKESLTPKSIDEMTLSEAIDNRVQESKMMLAFFLESHPLFSTCHNSDGEYYSVTSEKQQYLLSMISIAEAAKASGVEYTPSWNAKGKACTYDWTIDQLKQLALEIANYVRPLISKQQKMEVEIKALTDIASVKAYQISFE